MLRLILGTVTLAAAGYAVKEYCETNGCPWEDWEFEEYNQPTKPQETSKESFKHSKQFHKQKKAIYKDAMANYQDFLSKYSLQDEAIDFDVKLEKQKIEDANVTDQVSSRMEKILHSMETLQHNLSVAMHNYETDTQIWEKIQSYAQVFYNLAHVGLLDKNAVLETLVDAMTLCMQKKTCK